MEMLDLSVLKKHYSCTGEYLRCFSNTARWKGREPDQH